MWWWVDGIKEVTTFHEVGWYGYEQKHKEKDRLTKLLENRIKISLERNLVSRPNKNKSLNLNNNYSPAAAPKT